MVQGIEGLVVFSCLLVAGALTGCATTKHTGVPQSQCILSCTTGVVAFGYFCWACAAGHSCPARRRGR